VTGEDLTLEVTETAILDDREQARRVLTALNEMGINIAVDDFGTGHASISRLHGLPVSEVRSTARSSPTPSSARGPT